MSLRTALVLVALLLPWTAAAQDRGAARGQVEFGIKVAQNGLWREALYRWQRAVELDPGYAPAWNNLAVAYEQAGRFDDARKAYETALKLDLRSLQRNQ
jgi:Flp pilus assembly protein TadD